MPNINQKKSVAGISRGIKFQLYNDIFALSSPILRIDND